MTTFPVGEQTHLAVLPQQPALESVGADTPGSRDETAHGHPATVRGTGREHGRGETDGHGTGARRHHAKNAASAAEAAENRSGDAPTQDQSYTGGVGASRVFVLSKDGQPLMPCHPARARELLRKGRAAVARQVPFTIRLKDRTLAESEIDGVQLRIDPGSKGTGLALTDEKKEINGEGVPVTVRRGLISVELQHRGDQIRLCMRQRAGYRHRRRSANHRYRAPRPHNRPRPAGWLPPSLRHRVDTTFSLAARLCRYAPVTEIHVERIAFDVHSMSAGRDLTAVEYRQGTLAGTEARSYLHAKWNGSCAYCDATGVPLNIEHLRPRSRGGSDRISNLVLACVPCNTAKGNMPVEFFLADRPARLAKILQQARTPLNDATAMNATRWQLTKALETLGRPVHPWSGARTKWNRNAMGLAKTHTLDALCVGRLDHESGDVIARLPGPVLIAKTTGRGSYARTTPDRFGFPRLRRPRAKRHFGYATGDLVRAIVPTGKWAGTWTGRVSVRATGRHSLTTPMGRLDVFHRNLRLLQRGDGYGYSVRPETVPSTSPKNS
ncbi:RNA-guided endonuclease IscB [Streptomyces sp. NPDC001165]|uniref:RNA-guided endonuclease IscB n=1 Tax=Streptomyces sp. NPDC001165 TaxID=3364546 RepID=UPI0036AFE2A1